MTIRGIQFQGFNEKQPYARYFVELNNNTYIFIVRWDDYGDFATLNIYDYENTPIISGRALVNNLYIRNSKLPYELFFTQINQESYEPTIDNIEDEFALSYDDEVFV